MFTERKCGAGQWQCDNERCIDGSWKCNGYDDCGDNSDEAQCGTGKSIVTIFVKGSSIIVNIIKSVHRVLCFVKTVL